MPKKFTRISSALSYGVVFGLGLLGGLTLTGVGAWYSEGYQEAKQLREGLSTVNFIVAVEGN